MSNIGRLSHAETLPPRAVDVRHATLAGLCASLVGLGLARFAYTPLLPAIIEAHWFTASAASYLGAANLAGYLAGALVASPIAARASAPVVLRAMMLLTTAALLACAWPIDFIWFFAWRFLSGLSGGALMVLAAPSVLAHVAPRRRGLTSGVIFMGVGLGIAASGTLVPLLLHRGVAQAWIGLSVLSFALTLLAWFGWPANESPAPVTGAHPLQSAPSRALRALYLEYALNAIALVPHMVFLVDFVVRERGQGLAAGSEYWVLFGIGAVFGPLIGGVLADRFGFKIALRLAFFAQAIALWVTVACTADACLIGASVVMGASTPGVVGLVLGRINLLLEQHPGARSGAWSKATTCFAIFQAAAAYGMSFLLIRSGGHHLPLFAVGGAAMLVALGIDLVSSRRESRGT